MISARIRFIMYKKEMKGKESRFVYHGYWNKHNKIPKNNALKCWNITLMSAQFFLLGAQTIN